VAASAAPAHAAWAELLERTLLAEAAGMEPPATPPLHLRDAPRLPEGGEDASALVGALLAPVRSGLILTRWDLARAVGSLGLGLRMGERAVALRSMLSQDPRATLAWLARTRRPDGRCGTGGLKRRSARSGATGGSGPRHRGRCCSSWNG